MSFSTDDIAKAGRTTLRGARLWDLHDLFGTVERDSNGARVFTSTHIERAKVIGAAQMCGMSLAEIKAATMPEIHTWIIDGCEFLTEVERSVRPFVEFDL